MADPLTVIITGGTGCVGFAVTKALLQHASTTTKIHILDISIPSTSDKNFISKVTKYHQVDITDATAITALFENIKPNVVIHTASIIPSAARKRRVSDTRLWDVNVNGTKTVLDAAEKVAVEAFVYTSSCDVVKPDSWMDFVNATESETAHLMDAKKWDGEYPRTKVSFLNHHPCLYLYLYVYVYRRGYRRQQRNSCYPKNAQSKHAQYARTALWEPTTKTSSRSSQRVRAESRWGQARTCTISRPPTTSRQRICLLLTIYEQQKTKTPVLTDVPFSYLMGILCPFANCRR